MVSSPRRNALFSPSYQRPIIKDGKQQPPPPAPKPLRPPQPLPVAPVEHKIIGSPGGYGVALTPAIRCDDNTSDPGLISKVFYGVNALENANAEWAIFENIQKNLDPKNTFTLKMVEHCAKPHNLFNIVDKDTLGGILGDKGQLQIINMPNGGTSIADFIRSDDPALAIPLLEFIDSIIAILSGLSYSILNSKKVNYPAIVHRDIKPENMLIDKNNKITLIDFGLSIAPDEVYSWKEAGQLNHPYSAYPPEFCIMGLLYTSEHYKDANREGIINEITNAIEENVDDSKEQPGFRKKVRPIIEYFIDETEGFWHTDDEGSEEGIEDLEDTYESLLDWANEKHLPPKLDNYSLGVVIKKLIIKKKIADTNPSTDLAVVKNAAFLLLLNEIVMGMIDLDPRTRHTPYTSLKKLKAFKRFVKGYNSQKPSVTGGAPPPTARALALMPPPPRRASRVRSAPSATGRIVVPRVKFSEDRKDAYHALAELLRLSDDVADFTINMLSNKHTFDLNQKSPPRSVPANIGGQG